MLLEIVCTAGVVELKIIPPAETEASELALTFVLVRLVTILFVIVFVPPLM